MVDTFDELADEVKELQADRGAESVVRAILLIARILLAQWAESREDVRRRMRI